MEVYDANMVFKSNSTLGEGCIWDTESSSLIWVDIMDCKINQFLPNNRQNNEYLFDYHVGTVALTAHGKWMFTQENRIMIFDPITISITCHTSVVFDSDKIRFNDGKCNPGGFFWVGTMDYEFKEGAACLYEFNEMGKNKIILDNLTISNGMAWDIERGKYYFIDSLTYSVFEFSLDPVTFSISNKRIIYNFSITDGLPDGMTIDTDGYLWIALYGGGKIVRLNPFASEICAIVQIPAPFVTSCVFGGSNLDELFITTATISLKQEQREKYPLSGSLFSAKVPFYGRPSFKIKHV